MKKDFIKKVIEQGIVDTKLFRYIYESNTNEIKRLSIKDLDTTNAIDNWETVVKDAQ